MALPIDLVLVRHGESEGNLARRLSEHGDNSLFTQEFCRRHSSRLRLTDRGKEQAGCAGEWIQRNIGSYFDRYLVSGYARAMETAALLELPDATWYQDFYLRERDIGEFDSMPEDEKRDKYPAIYDRFTLDPFYWKPPNGESVAELCARVDRVLETLHRECSDKKAIVVCHGMVMSGFMIRIERLTPYQFLQKSEFKATRDRIRNCQIIHYSRRDPETNQISSRADWVRSICPWDLENSRTDWREIRRPSFSNEDLLKLVEEFPRIAT